MKRIWEQGYIYEECRKMLPVDMSYMLALEEKGWKKSI